MVTQFCESGQEAVLVIKAKLLASAKKKANKTFGESYEKAQKYRCCSALQRMWWMFRELDPLVLTKHINEMEQILALVNGLFELEVKDTNLDEVFNKWWLVYELTGKLNCKPAYRLLNKHLWSDAKLRSALVLAKQFSACASPFPSEVVRIFKLSAVAKLTKNYATITSELSKTIAMVKRIQEQKHQALAALLSLSIAVGVGIANFFSRFAWAAVAPGLGYGGTSSSTAGAAGRLLASTGMGSVGGFGFEVPVSVDAAAAAALVGAVRAVEAAVGDGTRQMHAKLEQMRVELSSELEQTNVKLGGVEAELRVIKSGAGELNRAVVPACHQAMAMEKEKERGGGVE
jgi:hypothetical protein